MANYYHKRDFKVIRGGLNLPPNMASIRFISAFVTDTRLMGVVGMRVHWIATFYDNPDKEKNFYQLFYYDAEEFGFSDYESVLDNLDDLKRSEVNLFGGLGGKRIPITEREFKWLLYTFIEFNKKHEIPLPEGKKEYMYFQTDDLGFSAKERLDVMNKICTKIENNYQAVHYFLMRICGKDFSAASYLCKGNFLLNQFETVPLATMVLNTIDLVEAGDDCIYMTESILDCDEYYLLVTSELRVNANHQIIGFESRSSMRISSAEAVMKLRRSEYVTVYAFNAGPEIFEMNCPEILDITVSSEQECGQLYLDFCKNNNFVKKRVFRLNDDVEGLFFVSGGQILAAAYTLTNILELEKMLKNSKIKHRIVATAKYEFKEPLIYEYINSGIPDFNEFVELVKLDSPDNPNK